MKRPSWQVAAVAALALWLGQIAPVRAAEVADVSVHHEGDAYQVTASLVVDVARPAAFAAATSFEALAGQARLIDSSRRIGDHRLSSVLSMCVAFYCKRVHQVMDYRLRQPTAIVMQVVPDAGDFRAGSASWHFDATGPSQTTIAFKAHLVPAFWVPPLIGDWAIAHALSGQIADTGRAVERLARALARRQAGAPSTSAMPVNVRDD